jgi:hypothetical protein
MRLLNYLSTGVKILVLFLLFLYCSCGRKSISVNAPGNVGKSSIITPRGDELKIELEKSTADKFIVKVTNVSDKPMFCAYLPGRGTDEAEYFPFTVERRASNKGAFEVYHSGGHFTPGLYAIKSGEMVRSSFSAPDKGRYRVKLGYYADEAVRDVVTEKIPEPGLTKAEQNMVNAASGLAVSPEITNHEND